MAEMNDVVNDELLRELQGELAQPFAHNDVHFRIGSTTKEKDKGMALAYLDARNVMDRLDSVVGVAGWQREYFDAGNGKTCCRIGLLVNGEWVWKADGAGDTDIEGDKGSFSDAFKRAAVSWGIGRYLYSYSSPWVAIQARGRSFAITDAGLKEAKAALGQVRAGDSSNSERRMIALLQNTVKTFCTSPELADDFVAKNKGLLAALSKTNKQTIWDQIQAIKGQTL